LILLITNFIVPFLSDKITNDSLRTIVVLVIGLAAAVPFLWAIMAKKPVNVAAYKELWANRKYSSGPLLIIEVFRVLIGLLLTGLFIDQLASTQVALLTAIPITVAVMFIFSKNIQKFYQRLERRFISNLNAREMALAAKEY